MKHKNAAVAAGLILVACFPAALSLAIHPVRPVWRHPGAALIARVTLAQVRSSASHILWIDARPRLVYQKEHIPGAVLLNEDEWDFCLPAVLAAWQPGQRIVVYCNDRDCHSSESVARRLESAGLAPTFALEGGWDAWQSKK